MKTPYQSALLRCARLTAVAAGVPVSLWLSWEHPYLFFAALAVALVVMVVLTWVFAKFLRRLARRVSGWFGVGQPST